ncbi:hypothetical protein SAMN05192562_10796 [Kosakonia arachidis]|uniref:Uncharacterized protein n=1 Tax=Kosakonia arachidis TaxID=551989 RepID=A0A1I7DWM9_9ENTR|nr:hypothetical protein [Kosakonia arachidis]SFU16045.1 hypothetical protein SAMN05192562_10796 [Kosakonia arachidis]
MKHDEMLPGVSENARALNFEAGFRRVGALVLLAMIIAALSGVFSGGYFSSADKSNADQTLKIHYERFGRLQNEETLKITLQTQAAKKYVISLGGAFNENYQHGNVWPQPDSMHSRGETLYLVYNNITHSGNFTVWLTTTPDKPGKSINTVAVNDEAAVRFWQFIYP